MRLWINDFLDMLTCKQAVALRANGIPEYFTEGFAFVLVYVVNLFDVQNRTAKTVWIQ